jgi:hypothetical protein
MGHSVHLIIGRGEAVAAFLRQWPGSRSVELRGGWLAIPVDEPLYEAIEAAHPGAVRPSGLDVSPFGLSEALAAATSTGGGLAYVETEYFGGAGGQSATAFVDGRQVMAPQTARGGAGPINQALSLIGVQRTQADDAFDAIGLGERRSMSDYEPEGPVRLRAEAPNASSTPQSSTVPMWLVIVIIAASIGVGIFVASTR